MFALFRLLLIVAVCAPSGGCMFYASKARPPALSASTSDHRMDVAGLERTYTTYAPARLRRGAPLLIVLHDSRQDAAAIRNATGFAFERLAAERGFAVAYPEGYSKVWNDGRKAADLDDQARRIDDKAFIVAMIDRIAAQQGVDPARVYVFGYSSGGQMAFRLAQERPDRIGAIAVAAASLPTPESSIARPSGRPVRAMIINGASDPINPYNGGKVTLFGFGDQGTVRSSRGTAEYFAGLNGAHHADRAEFTPWSRLDPTRVVRDVWEADGKVKVVLYTVQGGGHVVPQAYSSPAPILGKATTALDAPLAVCDFFGL